MNATTVSLRAAFLLALAGALGACAVGEGSDGKPGAGPLALSVRIPLPGVEGRIDHLALDLDGDRLFVAALGNDTVEVVDLAKAKRVESLGGLAEPQGVVWIPEPGKLVVTNGGGASAAIFDGGKAGKPVVLGLRADPDNARWDADAKRVWIGEGTGEGGALAAIDPVAGKVVSEIVVGGHPESFQLEPGGDRIFVNVPGRREVVVVDRRKGEVVARHLLSGGANYPMAIDGKTKRLYVAGRRPARLYVLDPETGKELSTLDLPGDADDLFLDGQRRLLYAIAGEGIVRVYRLPDDGAPELVGDVETARGARTGLLAPDGSRLFVAVPRRGGEDAEIRVYVPE